LSTTGSSSTTRIVAEGPPFCMRGTPENKGLMKGAN
jgi:hypothetical protein